MSTDHAHGVPFFTQNLTDISRAHHLIRGRDLRSPLTRENHERVHRSFRGAIRIQRLRRQG